MSGVAKCVNTWPPLTKTVYKETIMADAIIPQSHSPSLRFTATPGVYHFAPGATILDLEDRLGAKQSQLNAMLSVASESSLDCLAGSLSSYFWACRATAEEIADLMAELLRRHKSELAAHRGE